MPGNPPPLTDERDLLLYYIAQQRDGLKFAAYGLTPEQLREKPTKSALSVGGLLKHAANTESGWCDIIAGTVQPAGQEWYADTFALGDDDTVESLWAEIDRVAAETERVARSLSGLDHTVTLPDAPWYPQGQVGYTAHWVLLHVLEELARHAGHADIIREHIDGATMYELMAGAEGWPETDWIKPWKPPAS